MIRRIFKTLVVLVGLGIAAIAGFIVWLSWQTPDAVVLPKPTGPYAVGRVAVEWKDEARVDPLAPVAGVKRELTGWIWYPAVAAGEPKVEYQTKKVLDALRAQANPVVATVAGWLATDQVNVTAHALMEPALIQDPERLPVLLIKPGKGGFVVQYSSLAEDLASHGYVVVATDSPHTTPVVLYGDGRIALRSKAGAPPDNAPGHVSELAPGWPNDLAVPVIATWAEDERFMLDEVEKLNAAGRFAGRLNLDAVGAFGHSFGGASAMQFCKDDARCKAAVNVDGALWGDVALGGLKKPALFLMNDRPILQAPVETLPADARALVEAFNRVRAEVPNKESLIIVKGAAHFNFADASLQSERHVARWIGQIGTADPLEVIETTRKHLRTFFDEHLKKTSAP